MAHVDDYTHFVMHPRFGQRPRITGLNPETDYGGSIFLHWHSSKECRIPNTAIPADLSRQSPATVPVTHYFDAKRQCRDCGRPFIFFAEEQKYWYEELGFALESDCVNALFAGKNKRAWNISVSAMKSYFTSQTVLSSKPWRWLIAAYR